MEQKTKENKVAVPKEFMKILKDFYVDIFTTFPECKEKVDKDLIVNLMEEKGESANVKELHNYCITLYPKIFFDILYENAEIFTDASYNAFFLPDIDFKKLWGMDVSDNTKKVIWKYLQLILFSTVSGQKNCDSFGDTAKLFEAIDEDEFKKKLEESIGEMSKAFDISGIEQQFSDMSGVDLNDLPDPEELHQHITGLLDGNLGKLAQEIAEETAEELNIDMKDATSVGDVFQSLFKNPGKLMNMVKKVGSKLDAKLKSGELKESELMKEASELMTKMKSMPGMENMNSMLGKMGIPLGKNANVNMNAFQSHMKTNIRKATQKERMLKKLEERRAARAVAEAQLASAKNMKNGENNEGNTVTKRTNNKKKKRRRKNRKK
jgi:hypothetical protein